MHDHSDILPNITDPRVAGALAAKSAPVAEPPRAPVRPVPQTNTTQTRPGRARKKEPEGKRSRIPSLPPNAHPPVRTAPVVLLMAQTLFDVVAIAGAYGLAYWLRFESDIFRKFVTPDELTYFTMLLVTVSTIVVTFYFSKLYNLRRGASRVDEFYRIASAVSMGTVLSLATNSLILGSLFVYSRQILLMGWVMAIVFVTVLRVVFSFIVGELHKHGVDRARVLVVGTGPAAAMVVERLQYHRSLGYQVVGVVAEGESDVHPHPSMPSVPIVGDLLSLQTLVRKHQADEVILALRGASERELREIMWMLQDESVSAKIYPDAFQLMSEYEVSVGELSGLPLLNVKDVALRGWNRRLKRAFDVAFSLVVLTLTAPLMLLIALAIRFSSPGPVFFIQDRVGLDGVPFPLVKFRTMRLDRHDGKSKGGDSDAGGPGWTVPNDPRRTHMGTFLRRFSLDELPQFYNVLVGEMSVVGPRPEQPHYVEEFAKRFPDRYVRRHREKAGITGWAQVNGLRGDTSIEDRTNADVYYVENWSLLFDLKIIVRTAWSMFHGKNAY